jgi:hypothetical protein
MPEGILKIIQWVKTPPGASGSVIIMANDFVPDGAPLQLRGGEMSWPEQVYFTGISSPSPKAGDEIINFTASFVPAGVVDAVLLPVHPARADKDTRITAIAI